MEAEPVTSPLGDSYAAAAAATRSRFPTGCFAQQTAAGQGAGTFYKPPAKTRPHDALDQSARRSSSHPPAPRSAALHLLLSFSATQRAVLR